ncbi:hypothetical protein L1887_05199 [Cichorium endivia]|nr:hypothetical protein L1887_05199 [Cichorium endivia]
MQKVINSSIYNTKAKDTSYHRHQIICLPAPNHHLCLNSQEKHRQSHLHLAYPKDPFHTSSIHELVQLI